MAKFYTYFSQPVTAFDGPFYGGSEVVTPERTWTISVENPVAIPEWGLYDAIPGDPAPTQYHVPDDPAITLSFEGVEFEASGRVRETNNWIERPIDELLAIKASELESYVIFVAVQAYQFDAQFWVVNDEIAQSLRIATSITLGDRHKDRVLGQDSALGYRPGTDPDPTTYWGGNPAVKLIRDSNGNQLVTTVDEPTWGQIIKKWALFNDEIQAAQIACGNDIDAQYVANDWTALAAIDVQSAAYGWPDYYTGPVGAGFKVV